MRRNTSLPVSAHECAASALIDADPDTMTATVLAIAMTRLAPKAMMTVSVLSPPAFTMASVGAVLQPRHPVARHAVVRARHGLRRGMAVRRREFRTVVVRVG